MAPRGRGPKKQGIFANALYSKTVFKNLSTSVLKRVEKDIAKIVQREDDKPGETPDIDKWTKAPPLKRPRNDVSPLEKPKNRGEPAHVVYQYARQLPKALQPRQNPQPNLPHSTFKSANQYLEEERHHIFTGRDSLRKFAFDSQSPSPTQLPMPGPSKPFKPHPLAQGLKNGGHFKQPAMPRPSDIFKQPPLGRMRILETPTFLKSTPEELQKRRRKTNKDESESPRPSYFQDDPSMNEIVDRFCMAIPHLTLRNEDANTYLDAAFALARETLLAQINLREPTEEDEAPDLSLSSRLFEPDSEIYQTLHNQTTFWNIHDGEEGELSEEDGEELQAGSESPTRIDMSQIRVPDPAEIRAAFREVDQNLAQPYNFTRNILNVSHPFAQNFDRDFLERSNSSSDTEIPLISQLFTQSAKEQHAQPLWHNPPQLWVNQQQIRTPELAYGEEETVPETPSNQMCGKNSQPNESTFLWNWQIPAAPFRFDESQEPSTSFQTPYFDF